VHIMYCGIPYYLQGVHKKVYNYKNIYIKSGQKVCNGIKLYWSGWKYILDINY